MPHRLLRMVEIVYISGDVWCHESTYRNVPPATCRCLPLDVCSCACVPYLYVCECFYVVLSLSLSPPSFYSGIQVRDMCTFMYVAMYVRAYTHACVHVFGEVATCRCLGACLRVCAPCQCDQVFLCGTLSVLTLSVLAARYKICVRVCMLLCMYGFIRMRVCMFAEYTILVGLLCISVLLAWHISA